MAPFSPENPLTAEGSKKEGITIFLEVSSPLFQDARDAVARFADLKESPEYVHQYRVTALTLWNAATAGLTADQIIESLNKYARYPVPEAVVNIIREQVSRYGRLRLEKVGEHYELVCVDASTMADVRAVRRVQPFLGETIDATRIRIDEANRGLLKQALIKAGFPVEDLAGYLEGTALPIALRDVCKSGKPFNLRTYQEDAVAIFHASGGVRGGSGTLVLPCGAGKTVIGIAAMVKVGQRCLILTTNITALRQWMNEVIDKTDLPPDMVGEYSGEKKEIKPVTVSTYQLMTHRGKKTDEFAHMELFSKENWGLIIYDEVHMLPAPVFRTVANIQARRRLGLTATLVREDGCEDDVFSLIGPKKFDMPWKTLEGMGWIATAHCIEIRVPLPQALRVEYGPADEREKFRMAAENPAKLGVMRRLVEKHKGDNILIIGQYLDQLEMVAKEFNTSIITGKTPSKERDELYLKFRKKEITLLVVSKVANFAIDLPDANVAIQISGTFGSRQEEAQRLGRVLRPKGEGIENVAHFYSVISRDTTEQTFGEKRRLFLTQQGYSYAIEFEELPEEATAEKK